MRKLIIVPLLIALLAPSASALIRLEYEWTAPTEGSPVVEYVVEMRCDIGAVVVANGDTVTIGGEFADVATVPVQPDHTIGGITVIVPDGIRDLTLRVAGVDELDRQGPYSEPAAEFTDLGPPGPPGDPQILRVIVMSVHGIPFSFMLASQ
jgi:hypothetical protein